ncbi:MAG: polyisoprenoid-binding protein [Caulobacteraceae bacterium]|jgi:polyisoprenoid-binding protein YceI|nr:polyisoprenoid-binding protein [Caulobacteraceae bacterium]
MRTSLLVIAAGAALGVASPSAAQLPPGVYAGEPNYQLAPAGSYAVDPDHAAVVAKVSHIGYSKSVFRFETVSGTLRWDPANPSASALKVTVDTGSISTPVAGFAKQLAGPDYLKSAAFPQATFTATGFRQVDATHGRVDGALSLMGKTAPISFDVTLVGAGKGFMGHPRIGVEATGQLRTADYGLPPVLGTMVDVEVDAEFARK